jgi:hypothetical protein
VSAEHRISHESLERLQRAERLVRRTPTRTALLTGYTSTAGLSAAEQMALARRDPLEGIGRPDRAGVAQRAFFRVRRKEAPRGRCRHQVERADIGARVAEADRSS